MDTHQLRCFVSVAQTLNFTEAAKQNYITQPAISRKIRELEEQLGAKLFLRDKHSVSLTGEGVEFYRYALEMLEVEDDAKVRIHNLVQGRAGHIKIAFVSSGSFDYIRCLSTFTERYPLIQISADHLQGNDLRIALQQRTHDLYFSTTLSLLNDNSLSRVITGTDRMMLLCNERFQDVDPADFSTLADKPFAFMPRSAAPGLYDKTMALCHARGYSPGIMHYYNAGESVMLSVAAGVGVSIMPRGAALTSGVAGVRCMPIPGDDACLTTIITWRRDQTNTAAAKFLEVVRELYPNG